MTGTILQAIITEMKAQLASNPYTSGAGTVLLDINFDKNNFPSYDMPLVVIDAEEAQDTYQWLGGATNVGYNWIFDTYHYEPDAYTDDLTGYSTSLVNFIDYIRRAFSNMVFLTPGMSQIQQQYGFKFTLNGLHRAKPLPYDHGDGRVTDVYGYGLHFDSISIDNETNFAPLSEGDVEDVQQSGSVAVEGNSATYGGHEQSDLPMQITIPVDGVVRRYDSLGAVIPSVGNASNTPWSRNINLINSTEMPNTIYTIPPNSYVPFIGMTTASGTPSMSISDGNGNLIFGEQLVGSFSPCTCQVFSGDTPLDLIFSLFGDGLVNTNITVIRNYFKPWVTG